MKGRKITGFLAALTFLLAAVALQLYFNKDHYFAMNRAKCSFTMIVLIGAAITAIVRLIEGIWVKNEKQRMTLLDWCVLVFGCGSIGTCLLSQAPGLVFVGTNGMFVGTFTYLTGMLVYFVVSRNMVPSKWVVGLLITGWTAIFIWTIVNQCGTDMFGMHQNMRPGDEIRYVSSMGNVDSSSDAFAAIIPFFLVIGIMAASARRGLLLLLCGIGFLAAYSTGNEGVWVGVFVAIPIVVIACLSEVRKVKMALLLLFVVGFSLSVFHFLSICSIIDFRRGLIFDVCDYWIGEILTIISLVLLFLNGKKLLKFTDRSLYVTRSAVAWTFVAVIIGFVLISIVGSSHDANYGNTRGAIWKGSVWAFRLYNPVEMIFGQGSGMFSQNVTLAFAMLFGKETTELTYATCHNSLLQALLGNGIIGLACLLLGVYAMLRDWFRDLRPIVLRPSPKYESIRNVQYNEIIRVASFTAVMGYFGASLVESTYPHTVMLLFAMLGLYRSSFFIPRKSKEKKE